jgi:hypothetical protein
MSKYPLTESLGVASYQMDGHRYVRAADLERILEQAPVVHRYGEPADDDYLWWPKEREHCEIARYAARLVCVQPIVKDTAESLLREFVDAFMSMPNFKPGPLMDRARKLLGEG